MYQYLQPSCGAICAFVGALMLLVPSAFANNMNGPKVAMYMTDVHNVLDLGWDRAHSNLEHQLLDLGLAVDASSDGQPRLTGDAAPDVYVIPYQSGNMFYSSVEDMKEITSFVSSGGLVVILDAATGEGTALREFVSQALNYEGAWMLCKQTSTNDQIRRFSRSGGSYITDRAFTFLPGVEPARPWPNTLEDARVISTLTLCQHEDRRATATPLYTISGDETRVAAQAFGKLGSPGAVVWLGYSWKDGPQRHWGELLHKLITDFADGGYQAPTHATDAASDAEHPFFMDDVIAAAGDAADDLEALLRRSLADTPAVYPNSPATPSPSQLAPKQPRQPPQPRRPIRPPPSPKTPLRPPPSPKPPSRPPPPPKAPLKPPPSPKPPSKAPPPPKAPLKPPPSPKPPSRPPPPPKAPLKPPPSPKPPSKPPPPPKAPLKPPPSPKPPSKPPPSPRPPPRFPRTPRLPPSSSLVPTYGDADADVDVDA